MGVTARINQSPHVLFNGLVIDPKAQEQLGL